MKINIVDCVSTTKKTIALIKKSLVTVGRALRLKNIYVEVFLVGNSHMKKNVLAYPAPKNFPRPDLKKYRSLGELYLNPGHIRRHKENLVYMLIHGVLHLVGYDHATRRATMAMEKKEQDLMRLLTTKT